MLLRKVPCGDSQPFIQFNEPINGNARGRRKPVSVFSAGRYRDINGKQMQLLCCNFNYRFVVVHLIIGLGPWNMKFTRYFDVYQMTKLSMRRDKRANTKQTRINRFSSRLFIFISRHSPFAVDRQRTLTAPFC